MKMNFPLILCPVAAASVALSAFAADEDSIAIPLRYQAVGTAFESLKKALGSEAATAVLSIDPNQNTVLLNPKHQEIEKVRAWLTTNDLRPSTAEISATIEETVKAKNGSSEKVTLLAKPQITAAYGEPGVTISIGDGTGDDERTLRIDLVLKHIPGQSLKTE